MTTQEPMKCELCRKAPDIIPRPDDYIDSASCSNQECIFSAFRLYLDIWNYTQAALIELQREAFEAGFKLGQYSDRGDDQKGLAFTNYLAERSAK